ncbi:MAG: Tyrosine-protein kinase EpsD [Candidatus Ozemobacter sibiricus]|uniref:Tyrosine-protein kinase EpsD n=1 Tax=Candidatus Ozemobacter sibiricus TaxID=2268124 RepID=A0A367ZPF4_9BACT|nr:MAG: Tyrosine-protein kinase EpsD [Candidatus Ozemobacter sibiricus]
MAQESLFEGILRSLGRNRTQAFFIIAGTVLLTTLITHHFPPVFESTALLRILASDQEGATSLAASMNGILSQKQTLQDICRACGLDPASTFGQEPFTLEDAGSGLVRLTVRHSDPEVLPELSATIIKSLSDKFLKFAGESGELEMQALERKKALLEEKLEANRQEIAQLEGRATAINHPDAAPLEEEIQQLEARLEQQRKHLQSLPRIKVVSSRELTRSYTDTSNALSEARNHLFDLLKTYREKHPKVIEATSLIDRLERKLKGFSQVRDREELNPEFLQTQRRIEEGEARLRALRDKLQTLAAANLGSQAAGAELEALRSRRQSLEGLYKEVLMKLEDLTLKQTTRMGQIQVLKKDRGEPRPAGLSYIQRQILAFVGGTLLAIFLLYSPAPMKAEIVSVSGPVLMAGTAGGPALEPVQALLQLPALNPVRLALPEPDPVRIKPHDDRLLVLNDPDSPRLEPYKALCSNLQIALSDSGTRIILICSARAGMGRTTLAANLGVLFAQAGYSVVLVDANLRKPSLHRVFDASNHQGLSTALCGGEGLSLVQPTMVKHLGLLPSGPLPPSPAELLGSVAMIDLLDQLKRRVELVLIDTPGLLDYPDAGILASQAGGVVLLHREGEPEADICASRDFLKSIRAKVLGYVNS